MKTGKETIVWHPELSTILDCSIGDFCTIHSHVWIGNNVKIGNHCKVQAFSFIPDGVIIGDGVFVGPRVTFCNDKHPPSTTWEQTVVGDYVSIGAGAVILPGVTLKKHAIVGAGAVVTKDVESYTVVVGNPARVLDVK